MLWVTFAWGSCFVAISIGLQDAPLLWLAALRALVAGAAVLLVATVRRAPYPRGPRPWMLIVTLGLVNVALAYAAMFGGIIGLSTGAASVLANAQPLLILLPAWLFFRESPTWPTFAAMLVGFAGLLLVAIPSGFGTGAWLSLTSAAAVTAGTLIARVVDADPFVVAAWQLLIGGAVLALVAAVVEGPPAIDWGVRFVVVLLYLALVGTAATNVAWLIEVRHASLGALTTWTLLVPIVGVLLSVAFLHERQGVMGWAGTVIVVAAMVFLVVSKRWQPAGGQRVGSAR
ncbi:DMT family transporter [uncultured Schumannella sp.]|uniref:DMT family transporter n=1 Tax=uncultured Schumannella sp. TaxID=1195956 RepID=UPI0025E3617B|nr:DMT family transporter [uncultured Schumannella sp.]